MSRKQQIIVIEPGAMKAETYTCFGFICPKCNGRGGFSMDGYMTKFKKNFNDPDWEVCGFCDGEKSLKATVTVEWSPQKMISL